MHTNRNIQGQAVPLARNKKPRLLTGLLLAAIVVLCGKPTQASVVEFAGGPTTTQTDAEVYFSPLTGQVWTSYSNNALFAIANSSGNLAIAFNTTPDGTLVVAPNSLDPSLATVARLSSGAVIGPGSLFDNTEYTLAESDGLIGNWNALGSGFFGFRFGTGTDVHYGWAGITVLPDFNITLNSFAYETASGQPITIETAPVPEPSSFALVGILGVLGLLFAIRRRFSQLARWVGVASGLVVASTVLPAQTSTTPLPGQTDPVGSRLTQFRSDHLFSIIENPSSSSSNTVLNTFGVQYTTSPFDFSLSNTSYTTSTPTVSGRQYHAVSGHIIQPNHEDVAIAYVDGSKITVQIVGQPAANVTLPTAILPRYTATLPNGSSQPTVDFIAMAAGDLDQALDESGNYHDEVVIAYVTAQNTYDVVVLDYSQNAADPQTGNVTVQQPNVVEFQALSGLQFNPAMMINSSTNQSPPGQVLPYDNIVSVSVGNFDSNGAAEIAVAGMNYQPAQGNNLNNIISVQTLRYRPEVSTMFEIGLNTLSPPPIQEGSNSQQPAYLGANLTMTSGDYLGSGADDLALGYVAYGPAIQPNEAQEIYPSSVINLLNESPQTQSIQVYLQPTAPNGSPTQLIMSGIPAGSIPKQLTITNAGNCSNPTNCPWNVLNGTWYTTFTSSPSSGGQIVLSIPADTSELQQGSVQITVALDTPLAQAPGNTPLQIPANPVSNSNPNDYPKLQLVSGLFQYDPTNGFSLSRRQLAAVYNNPPCQSTSCSSTNYSIVAAWYYVSPDQQKNPQFILGGSNATQFQEAQGGQHQVSATAGAFRGNTIIQTPPTPDLPPVWSLAINSWTGSGNAAADFVSILEPNGNSGFNVNSQILTTEAVDPQARLAVVNYDADGSSVYLGAPIHLSFSNLITPTAIIKEPPKHLAWFQDLSNCPTTSPASTGPGICNINRTSTFNVQFQDSSSAQSQTTTQETDSSDFSQSNSVSASASVDVTVFPGISNKLSVSDTQSLSYSKSQTDSSYYKTEGEVAYDAGATATLDDLVEAQYQNLDVWRYRVYSESGNASSPPTFYDLTYPSLPTNSTPNATGGGSTNDWYNPVHENGNVLSYSPLPPSQLPDDYSTAPYTVNNSTSGITNGVLYQGNGFCYSGVTGSQSIKITGVSTQTDTVETDKTNSWDQDMELGDTVKVEDSELSTSVDADLGQNQSLSQSTATKNTTTGSKGVTFNFDAGNGQQSYNIFPIFYNSNTGVLKFVYYVSIPTAASTGTCGNTSWWTDVYGGVPDPALNLPFRFNPSSNPTTGVLTWSLNQDLGREQLRSFFLTSNSENTIETTSQDNPVYTPLATNPAEGDTIRMAVRVYNFSLYPQNAENVTVQFSAMPYDSGTDNELGCGTPSSGETGRYCAPSTRTVLGTTTTPLSIPYWGSNSGPNWVVAALPWTIPTGFISSNQNATEFRVYVNLNYSGTELNPPQQACNHAQPSSTVCPSQIGVSSADPNWDPNAPGQNNEGWSYITLQAASSQNASMSAELTRQNVRAASVLQAALNGATPHPTSAHNLKAAPDSLAAVDPAGHLKSGLVVAYLGRRLHVRVKAQSEMNDIQELQKALVYERSGRGKKVIALKALRGASLKGTSAWFHWTPTTPGLHQLTAELLEPLDDATKGDNKAKLSVIVVRAPGDVNGDGSVDSLDTEIIREQIGKSTAESKCGAACDLNGDGRIGPADLELAMAHCDNAYCAISHTLPFKEAKKQRK